MNRAIFYLFLSLIVWGLTPCSVLAQPAAMPKPPMFARMDKDGNGSVSEVEFNEFKAERMTKRAAEGRQMIGMGDSLSFADYDTNKDGAISSEEMINGHKLQWQKRMEERQSMGPMGAGPFRQPGCMMKPFEVIDANHDGSVSADEYKEATKSCPMLNSSKNSN